MNKIIIDHFPEIQDYLLNFLELNDLSDENLSYSKELVIASIDQKTDTLSRFNFKKAINLKDNLKFFYFFLGVLFIGFVLYLCSPASFSYSITRLKNYQVDYQKPSPVHYELLNDSLLVGKGDDIEIKLKVTTNIEFDKCYILFGDNKYLMTKDSLGYYSYQFESINNDVSFRFIVDKYFSTSYQINVVEKPLLSSFKINVHKPSYLNQTDESYTNLSEFTVPVGSNCEFEFDCFATDSMSIKVDSTFFAVEKSKGDLFKYNFTAKSNSVLYVSLVNHYFSLPNYLQINISVVDDEYPTIKVVVLKDSTDYTKIYFNGVISDDYGFHNLSFVTKCDEKVDSLYPLDILKNTFTQGFSYIFDFSSYSSKYQSISYYFDVSDNDVLHGYKHAFSDVYNFQFPSIKDISAFQNEKFESIDDLIKNGNKITDDIKNELEDLQKKLLNKDITDWERKEIMKDINSKKQELEDVVKKIGETNKDLDNYMKSFSEQDQQIIEKQKQIEDLLENMLSDDLKKLLDEFNNMLNSFQKDKMNDLKDKMDISLDDLSKQLDRNIEILKRTQIEQKVDLINKKLDKLVQNQDSLISNIDKDFKKDEFGNKQDSNKSEFDELKKEYEDVKSLNEKLTKPINLYDFKNEFDNIDKEYDQSRSMTNEKKQSKANESLKKNKSNLSQLAFSMKQMASDAFASTKTENIDDLMKILDNLLVFSFNQESLLKAYVNDYSNTSISEKQMLVIDNFNIIKDSLYSLATREPAVNSVVNKEIVSILNNFSIIRSQIREGSLQSISANQQLVMTSANNLALFLSEIIQQLQKQMANSTPGNQNCEKQGNNPNPNSSNSSQNQSLSQLQQSLQQQLEKAMQMMKNGSSGKMVNNELGKALMQQEMLQDRIRELMNSGTVGSKAQETLKSADQLLNQVREDIMRKNITNETLNRQKQIMTRLLEADNAEMEREKDEKRKSNTARQQFFSETAKSFDNTNSNDKFEERLLKDKLLLKPFYQKKYQSYINSLGNVNEKKN